jgi:O-antigen/teichoic acid export membrane protein
MIKEKFLKLRSNSLVSSSAIYLVTNIIHALIPFLLLPIFTRHLTPAEYGELAIFYLLVTGISSIIGLSLAGAANRKYYDNDINNIELSHYIGACLQLLIVISLISFAFIFSFRYQFSAWLGIRSEWLIWALLISVGSTAISIRLGQWQIKKQAKAYANLQIFQSLTNMLLSLLLVVVLLENAQGRVTAIIYTTIIFSTISLLSLYKNKLLIICKWNPSMIKEILNFGVPLIPHSVGTFLILSIDRFIVNEKLGLAQTGIYMVAVQLTAAAGIFFSAINNAYVPWLFERLKKNDPIINSKIVFYSYIWFIFIFGAALSTFSLGPWLVTFVAGPEYSQAGEIIGWLSMGQAFSGMYLMVTNYVFYSKKTVLLSSATILTGVINVALLIILINMLGMQGAAIAFCISMAIRFILTWRIAHLKHPMPWFRIHSV